MRQAGVPSAASDTTVMTGATGFLGSHLLARLLQSDATERVVCLVRQEPPVGSARLRSALRATGVPVPDGRAERIVPVRADLTHPQLGLDRGTYEDLAGRTSAVWHAAADIRLEAGPAELDRVNVDGTRHILDFAAASAHRPRVLHVSTAYVAGRRRHGHVAEGELDGSEGFLTEYERSKFRAEELIRECAARSGTRVTVFRPSVLCDDRPARPGGPYGPHTVLAARLARFGHWLSGPTAARLGLSSGGVTVAHVPGDPEARLNVLPVQSAADTMTHLAHRQEADGVTTYHVVHPHETPVQSLLDAMTYHAPWLRVRITPEGGVQQGELEDLLIRQSAGVAAYARLHRTYDRSLSTALAAPEPPALDSAYLRASFAPPAAD